MNYHELVPALSADDYAALKSDIEATQGPLVPVEYDEDGNILDGFHRVKACEELGIKDWPRITRLGFTEAEKRAHARRLNLARRHLTTSQKRDMIEAQLKELQESDTALSDRQVADMLGVHHTTVTTTRRELEDTGALAKLANAQTKDGRSYPRERKRSYKYEDKSPEGQDAILGAAAVAVAAAEKEMGPASLGQSVRSKTQSPKPTEQQDADHERLWRVLRALENIAEQDVSPAQWLDELPHHMRQQFQEHMHRAGPWLEEFIRLWRKSNAH